jgi:oxysterol-binding protein 1
MQGETFEYVSLDKKYRYVSEQVCHHPPISACIAQSPAWEYFGEGKRCSHLRRRARAHTAPLAVDAKSKFLGKSFEIRPTGIAHVNIRIPKEWAPDLPPAGDRWPNMVTEHYSWTKVTTSVSNFLFGNPIIDHYGDMVVTNHRTGDTCTLTFKPRGWRGGNACEIKGKVVDKAGEEHWDIAGKWSSQLVARRVGAGHGDLAPDASVPTTKNGDVAPEYIRLWKNSEKPAGMPFNL